MSFEATLHLVAGLGALALGVAILIRDPTRKRSRYFALLCGALSLWTLGTVVTGLGGDPPSGALRYGSMVYLLGSCAAAPLGLHFALVLIGAGARWRYTALTPAYGLAGILWISVWFRDRIDHWETLAIVVLGGTLAIALLIIGRHAARLPRGPQRKAHLLIFAAGIVTVLGGLTDFVPRPDGLIRIGPVAVLLFLLVVCAVVVRHRFFDVDALLIRIVAVLLGATAVAGVFYIASQVMPRSFPAWLLLTAVVFAVAWPVGRAVLSGAESLLRPSDPAALALLETSRRVARASTLEQVWSRIEEGRGRLPGNVHVDVFVRRREQDRFHLVHRGGPGGHADTSPLASEHPLPRLLESEALPISRVYVEQEVREPGGIAAGPMADVLRRFDERGVVLAVPLLGRDRLIGWIEVDGSLDQPYLTAEVAAAFLAVGNQAIAGLERLEAFERARRGQALAAIGELAAGLAHEVRNPVAAIRGAAQALTPDATERQRAEMLEVIEQESARLDRVVGEFLSYARPQTPRREPVCMEQLARRSVKGLELSGRRLLVELDAAPGVAPALGDPDQLQRAVDNLVRNAWEAAGNDGRLQIDLSREEPERVAVRFEDDGPGIEAEELSRLFQPFYTTKPTGTGLGLALVQRIVSEHGGEIRVDGRPGVGAAFTLVLPVSSKTTVGRAAPRTE